MCLACEEADMYYKWQLIQQIAKGEMPEGHSEDDRQCCEGQPQFVRQQVAQGRPQHQPVGSPVGFPSMSKRFIRSRTRSAVGSSISSTMRPSARNTTLWAYEAALGS